MLQIWIVPKQSELGDCIKAESESPERDGAATVFCGCLCLQCGSFSLICSHLQVLSQKSKSSLSGNLPQQEAGGRGTQEKESSSGGGGRVKGPAASAAAKGNKMSPSLTNNPTVDT